MSVEDALRRIGETHKGAPVPLPRQAQACAKCGGEDILIRYHGQKCSKPYCSCSACASSSREKRHDEHLHYHCRTCQFDWTGDVL